MAWIGSCAPIAGSLSGFAGVITKIRDFDAANTVTNVVWRVGIAPDAGTVVMRLHDQDDGLGNYLEATIADGEYYISQDGTLSTTDGLWQEVVSADNNAMNLSGDYIMQSLSGITDYFTTLARVKQDLNESGVDTDRDTVITSMIAGVTRRMQDWMSRDIVQGTTTEKLSGHSRGALHVTHYPITTITSLSEASTDLTEGTDFESIGPDLTAGEIFRLSGGEQSKWAFGRRNVAITYDHGYTSVPESLENAATALVVVKWFETVQSAKGWRGMSSKGVDPAASTAYDKDVWLREVIPAMAPYRRAAI